MRVEIDSYRGWDIFFNTDSGEFYTYSNEYDTDKSKKTFESIKSYIDDFIKNNSDFKPILVEREDSIFSEKSSIEVIGIRKDGRFIYKDKNGEKKQLSEHYERDYFLVLDENKPIFKDIESLKLELKSIEEKIKNKRLELKKITLSSIKEKYIK